MKSIVIRWTNGFGNNLFQYHYACLLREGFAINPKTKKWKGARIISAAKRGKACFHTPIEYGFLQEEDAPIVIDKTRNKKNSTVVSYTSSQLLKPIFFSKDPKRFFKDVEITNNKDLILQLRLGKDWERKGRVLSPEKYHNALSKIEFDKLFIVTDVHNHSYLENFKKYNAVVVSTETREANIKTGQPKNGNLHSTVKEFNLIRSFNKIMFSPESSFGFWAALLSNAGEIYHFHLRKDAGMDRIVNFNKGKDASVFKNWINVTNYNAQK